MLSGGPPGGPPDPFGPPYPLDPLSIDLDGEILDVERTFDKDGITYQIFDKEGNVRGGSTIKPQPGD